MSVIPSVSVIKFSATQKHKGQTHCFHCSWALRNVLHFTKQLHELTPLQVARKVHSPFGDGNRPFAAAHKHSTITGSGRVSSECCFCPLLRTRASRVAPTLNSTKHMKRRNTYYVNTQHMCRRDGRGTIGRQPLLEGTVLSWWPGAATARQTAPALLEFLHAKGLDERHSFSSHHHSSKYSHSPFLKSSRLECSSSGLPLCLSCK